MGKRRTPSGAWQPTRARKCGPTRNLQEGRALRFIRKRQLHSDDVRTSSEALIQIRATLIDELRELYVLAARARGVSRARAIVSHALRNSLIPVVTIVGLQLGAVLTGTIITETIFAWPGVGRRLIQAINFRDYPLVQGCILLIAVTYVTMNLLVDLAYAWLDPRIRYS